MTPESIIKKPDAQQMLDALSKPRPGPVAWMTVDSKLNLLSGNSSHVPVHAQPSNMASIPLYLSIDTIIKKRIDELKERYRDTASIEDLYRLREARRIAELLSVHQDGGKANPRQEKGGPARAALLSDSSAMDNRST